jgi:DNA segregation ATPase FtsK/SpoIIIE, S-DNA-T family
MFDINHLLCRDCRGMAINDTFDDTDDSAIPEGLKRFVRRRAREVVGLGLLAVIGVAGASLASWSPLDPSFNHATDVHPTNWLGKPGAIIADELFRFFGLAAIALLVLPLVWVSLLLTHQKTDAPKRMVFGWIGSVAAFSVALSTLPAPLRWPVPSGLGGQVGDVVSGAALTLLSVGMKGFIAATMVFLLSAVLALWWGVLALGLTRDQALRKFFATCQRIAVVSSGARLPQFEMPRFSLGGLWRRRSPDDIDEGLAANAKLRRKRIEPPKLIAAEDDVAEEDEGDDEALGSSVAISARKAPPKQVKAKRVTIEEEFELPELDLLTEPKKPTKTAEVSREALEENARALEGVLDDFGVKGQIVAVKPGPVVTLYELEPAPGIKSSRVISLADDIARSMSAISARVAVVQGRNAIGIELPNAKREMVYLREMFQAENFINATGSLTFALGKNIGGEPIYADLARMPHLLIAGTTGSGKSVGINTMILSLLYRLGPDRCKLIMIDPKMLELSVYEGIPHLLAPVVTDPRKAVVALKWAVREMEERYKKMSKVGVRNVDGYNARVAQLIAKGEKLTRTVQTGFDPQSGQPIFEQEEMDTTAMPYIVVIIDEMADLMMVAGKDIEGAVQRLAQMARAAGIHVVMATQRPSVDVITGTIKANFPTRVSFQVTSKIDSRTILGEQGAEQLLGQGDMLYMAGGGRISRLHGPFVSDGEVEAVVKHLKAQGQPDYVEAVTEEQDDDSGVGGVEGDMPGTSGDSLYDQAVAVVLRDKKVSTSYVQRRLQIGYNKAASLIERMEKEGLISSANATGKREILVPGESAR